VEAIPSPDGARLATRYANELRTWELSSGKMLRRIAAQGLAHGLRWSADGRQLAVGRAGKFAWYDAASGRLVRRVALAAGEVYEARLLAGGRQVFATFFNNAKQEYTKYLLAAADGKIVTRFQSDERGYLCGVADDGRALWHGWTNSTSTFRVGAIT